RLDLVDLPVADTAQGAPGHLRDAALPRAGRREAALAPPLRAVGVRHRGLARRVGRLRVLHLGVRVLQQDLGIARSGDHHADLAVAGRDRAAARRRAPWRYRAEPGAARRSAGRARAADLVSLGLIWPLACSSARKRSR